jgi:anaphase-promoting complex subunit 3
MAFGGEDAESYYDDGLTASMKGDLDQAVKCFEKALQLDKHYFAAHHQLGKCYLRRGDTDRAIELFRYVVFNKPKQIPPRLDLGVAYQHAGQLDKARKHFAEISTADPTNSRAFLGLAQVDFDEGKWMSAVENTQLALMHGGANFPALFLRGRAARLSGDLNLAKQSLEEADTLLEKSIELNPDQPESYFLRGEVNFVREQFSTALDCYRDAEDRADDAKVYTAFGESFTLLDMMAKRALCLQRMGRDERARDAAERVLEKDPDHHLARSVIDSLS